MRALASILFLLSLSSCGGPYDGSYSGTLSGTISCDDGTMQPSINPSVTWDITSAGEVLTIDAHGSCGTWSGTLFETSGTINAKTCSAINAIKGGRLTFSASSVIVNLTATSSVDGPLCTSTLTGTLTKQ